jgi:osmotically-inducible protein OsmY
VTRALQIDWAGGTLTVGAEVNGNVTLEGVVDSEADKNLAHLRAGAVPNVFSVKNNLVVRGGGK